MKESGPPAHLEGDPPWTPSPWEWCIRGDKLLGVSLLEFWASQGSGNIEPREKPVGTSLSQSVSPFTPTTLVEISFFLSCGWVPAGGRGAGIQTLESPPGVPGTLTSQPLPLPSQFLLP